MTKEKAKVVVFIDGSNMFYLQKKLGWMVDWGKVSKYLHKNYKVAKINFYEPYRESAGTKESFFSFLKKQEMTVVTKPVKIIVDSLTGKILPKANFDVEVTRDILLEILYEKTKFENFILFSGDSDFAYLVRDLRKLFHLKIIVYAGRKNLSWELRVAVDEVIYIEDLKSEFFRKEWGLTKKAIGATIKPSYRRRPKKPALFLSKRHAKANK